MICRPCASSSASLQIFYIKEHNIIREESGIGKVMPDLL